MADTGVDINDTLAITATATDDGVVEKFFWALGGSAYADTTAGGTLRTAFSTPGVKLVRVKVIDDEGVISAVDSCRITVTQDTPTVNMICVVRVNINDTITITATATDKGVVERFYWALDGIVYAHMTDSGAIRTAFATPGIKLVKVKAADEDAVMSAPDSCRITVTLDPPMLVALHDTTISQTMSLAVHATATDANSNGVIRKYYWDIGANGWDDSTDTEDRTFVNPSGGTVVVRWAARDDDGLMTADTFVIIFNRLPVSPSVSAPSASAAWIDFNQATGNGTLPLTLYATDPDLPSDTLTFTLSTGPSPGSLSQVYNGRSAYYNAANIDPAATVCWRLIVRDLYGDTAAATGSFVTPFSPAPPPAGMVYVSGGTFQMGSSSGDANEKPVHHVAISWFYMDTTEVTQADYLALMGVNPSGFSGDDKQPVEQVTWFDAALYCNARSKRYHVHLHVRIRNAGEWQQRTRRPFD
jgi:hypothetical protein